MKTVFKILFIPIKILIYILWAAAALAAWLYSRTHGLLLTLLFIPTIFSCFCGLWKNALSFLIIAVVSVGVIFVLEMIVGVIKLLDIQEK